MTTFTPIAGAPPSGTPEDLPLSHVLEPGDNPSTVAARYGVPVEQIMQLNGLDDRSARHLRPGMPLTLRPSSAPAATPPKPQPLPVGTVGEAPSDAGRIPLASRNGRCGFTADRHPLAEWEARKRTVSRIWLRV